MLAMHQALHGLRQVGGHEFITAQSERFVNDALEKLIPLVGEDEAMQTLCVIYVDADKQQIAEEVSKGDSELGGIDTR